MPTYLCHGFRWHRDAIRFFVIVQDIDDAAPEWVVAPRSSEALITQFYELFDFLPYRNSSSSEQHGSGGDDDRTRAEIASRKRGPSPPLPSGQQPETVPRHQPPPSPHSVTLDDPQPVVAAEEEEVEGEEEEEELPVSAWSAVQLLEEFDPEDLSAVSGPWAYVADHVVRVDTSALVVEEALRYEALERSREPRAMRGSSSSCGGSSSHDAAGWFEKLRGKLQSSEPIRWYVVVCGDEERASHLEGEAADDSQGFEKEEQQQQGEEEVISEPEGGDDKDQTIRATSEGHGRPQQQLPLPPSPPPPPPPTKKEAEALDDDNIIEFRLPELLPDPKARPRETKSDWNAVLEKPPPFLEQQGPPAAPSLAASSSMRYQMLPGENSARRRWKTTTSRISGLARLFTRRLRNMSLRRGGRTS